MNLTKKDMELAEKHMKTLGLSKEDAIQLVLDDKAIDKGEKMEFDLTDEQKKVSKKYTGTGTKKRTVYKFDSAKSKKENPEKRELIARISEFLTLIPILPVENMEVLNPERQISFKIGENSYELTLTLKRKQKK